MMTRGMRVAFGLVACFNVLALFLYWLLVTFDSGAADGGRGLRSDPGRRGVGVYGGKG